MSSYSLKNYSKKFQVNVLKSSLSKTSKSSSILLNVPDDDENSSRQPKRVRLSNRKGQHGPKFTALFNYEGYASNELNFHKGEEVQVICQDERERVNWWKGRVGDREGMFPSMYVAQKSRGVTPKEIHHGEIFLQESIGKGGFATVRRGVWKTEEVAVKIIHRSQMDMSARSEATFYWLLRHPNVISLFGSCSRPPDYWLVMEYARGGSLSQVLSTTFLPPHIILDWSAQIAQAMKYLHHDAPIENIIHRDLKSKNILIYEPLCDGSLEHKTLKITDFGLARQALQTTILSNAAGTFEWMAPEVFRNHQISIASDVWSFGVVLWEMLTSQVPYKSFNQFQIVLGVGNNTLRLPIPQSCPKVFDRLLNRCWSVNPKERPLFAEILRELQAAEASLSQCDRESFAAKQHQWWNEVEQELQTIRTESAITTIKNLNDQPPYDSFLAKATEGLKQRYAELHELEMKLVEMQLYYAVKQLNNTKKQKKKLNFFSWRKKHSLKISTPSNFQHKLQTIVEETNISPKISPSMPFPPPFVLKTIRVKTDSSQHVDDAQRESTLNQHPHPDRGVMKYTIEFALREVMKTATCISASAQAHDSSIVTTQRESLLPPNPVVRPTTLDVKPLYDPSQTSTNTEFCRSPSNTETKTSPFKVEIVQTPSRSKVYVTGNNPGEELYFANHNAIINDDEILDSTTRPGHSLNFAIYPMNGNMSFCESGHSFSAGIGLYGSLSTLKRSKNSIVSGLASVGKVSMMSVESFPYDKVNAGKSWQNVKQGKGVAELRAFFNQMLHHDKLTVH